MAHGKFIVLEGGEGVGKSTQSKKLVEFLKSRGIEAIATREVGGSPSAEEIRKLWLDPGEGHWDSLTEVLLIMAARREHLARTVWPALEAGTWVVSDRFVDSTRAYQGYGLEIDLEKIDAIYNVISGGFHPDLTLLLDLSVKEGLRRMALRNGPDDRYQQQNVAFHERLREAYRDFAQDAPHRYRFVDASHPMEQVAKDIEENVSDFFELR
jgi:dTMP kinase